jgi:hypothetical protein
VPRESAIERAACKALHEESFDTEKCGKGGRPDQLVVCFPKCHVWFEFKQPGGRLTKAQERRIPKMRERGEVVEIIDSVELALKRARFWRVYFFSRMAA